MSNSKYRFWSVVTAIFVIVFFGMGPVVAALPNDPNASQWSYETAAVYRAWEQSVGSSNVVVAIIDNGFDETHSDLQNALWVNEKEIPYNLIDDDKNGYIDDIHGWNFVKKKTASTQTQKKAQTDVSVYSIKHHATVVAGIIGATGNNGKDGAGIAYGVKLMNLQVIDNDGLGEVGALVEAIYYAVNNGAQVINISMVGKGYAPEVRAAIEYAYQKGVTVVGAAGNDMEDLNIDPQFPVCADAYSPYTSIIGVSAVDSNRRLAGFSNIGGSCVDVTAPGVNISGPIRSGMQNELGVSYVDGWSGTSFAAPFVTAAAALLKSIQPMWNVDQIVRTIKSTVYHTPSTDETAYKEAYGNGLLQVGQAVEAAKMTIVPTAKIFVEGQYDTLFTAPRRVLVAAPGEEKYADIFQGNKIDVIAPYLKNATTFATLRDLQGAVYYITLAKKNAKEQTVTVYTAAGVQKYQWTIDARTYQIVTADVYGDPGKEIALLASNTGEITVFALDGVRIGSIPGPAGYKKGFATTRNITQTGKDEIITASETANSLVVVRKITGVGVAPEVLFETTVKSLGSVTYLKNTTIPDGDMVVLGSDTGSGSLVNMFSLHGKLQSSFRPYDLGFRGGVSVSSVVYGEEGKEHVVVTPKQGIQPLRIFDRQGNRVLDRAIDTVIKADKSVITSVATF